jgi:drug/metabolite transporter (DMT)-like permease
MGGFCFALTNVLLRKLHHTPEGARMLAMFIGGAVMSSAVATLGMQLGVVPAATLTGTAWWGLALALSLALLAGNLALQFGAARLSASSTSIIMLSEVVVASVSSVLLGTGSLSAQTLAGGALILLASLLAVRMKALRAPVRSRRRPTPLTCVTRPATSSAPTASPTANKP